MQGSIIDVLSKRPQTRRQIARALCSSGNVLRFFDTWEEAKVSCVDQPPALIVIDCESVGGDVSDCMGEKCDHPVTPVIYLFISDDKDGVINIIRKQDATHVIAKHGAIRAAYPILDERELLVTCEKMLRKDVFGIEKYINSWGVVFHEQTLTSMKDREPALDGLEGYLRDLDCQERVIPSILTVAEEFIMNAVVHAPRDGRGMAKYADQSPLSSIVLDESEYVSFKYGCDGQRLMLSVADLFGSFDKSTFLQYLARALEASDLQIEQKTSGAGLGIWLSFANLHQLVVNVEESVRTELIAGWNLRINSASEFRKVGKSINLFWLPAAR